MPVDKRPREWPDIRDDSFFSSSWDEFQKRRQRLREETKELWNNLDEEDVTRRMASSSLSMTSSSSEKKLPKESPSGVHPNDFASKRNAFKNEEGHRSTPSKNNSREEDPRGYKRRIRFENEKETFGKPKREGIEMGQIRDDEDCFEVTIDTSTYLPEEIKISVGSNRILIVEGKHEDDLVSRQFNRKFSLPYNCQIDKILPTLHSASHKLKIWIPKTSENLDLNSKLIPLIIKD